MTFAQGSAIAYSGLDIYKLPHRAGNYMFSIPGPRDCADGSDELHCFEVTNYFCYTYRHYFMNVAQTVTGTVSSRFPVIIVGNTSPEKSVMRNTPAKAIKLILASDTKMDFLSFPLPLNTLLLKKSIGVTIRIPDHCH